MAFNTKEQQIIKWGAENGKTRAETEQALIRFRTTGSPTTKEEPTILEDLGGDILETGKGIFEQVKGAGEKITERLSEEAPTPTMTDRIIQTAQNIVGAGAEAFKGVSRTFGEAFLGAGKALLPQRTEEKIKEVATDFVEGVVSTDFAQDLLNKYNSLSPTQKQGVNDALGYGEGLADLITLGGASKLKAVALKEVKKVVDKTVETSKKVVEKTGEIVEKGREKLPSIFQRKPELTGEEKITADALDISQPKFNKEMEVQAAREGRLVKDEKTGKVTVTPSRRDYLIADSIRLLVEQGRINADNLPFQNIPEISLEVSRINQGIKEMLADRKIPFNENQLRKRLNDAKKDAKIIFTTDPTLERTYNALIEAFIKEVSKKDTLGLFEARQGFDKLPAVKKLLDSSPVGENLRKQAVLDIRRAANNYVADQLPKNNPLIALLREEAYMLEAISNASDRSVGLVGTTNISRFFDDNPTIKALISNAIPVSAGAVLF